MQTIDAILDDYADILKKLDEACGEVRKNIPEIPCKKACDDCCQNIFPISFVEAYYLADGLAHIDRMTRRKLTQTAQKIYKKIAHRPWGNFQVINGTREKTNENRKNFTLALKSLKIPCPILQNHLCALYNRRNPDCRIHGFAFNKEDNAIMGCFRFAAPHFQQRELQKHFLDFNLYQKEKQKLDYALQNMLTMGALPKTVSYATTILHPLLRDYQKTDWIEFFQKKYNKEIPQKNAYSLIIDMSV